MQVGNQQMVDDVEETATDRLSVMLSGISSEGRAELKVYRKSKGQLEYCATYQPAAFEDGNFDIIRAEFGPGEYELRLYATSPESGRFVVRNRIALNIAAQLNAVNQAQQAPQLNGLNQVLESMMRMQQETQRLLMERNNAPPVDPMAQMQTMLAMMASMKNVMGNDHPKSNIGEIMAAIREIKAVSAEITPEKQTDNDNPMEMFGSVMETIKAVAGNPKPQPQQHPQPLQNPIQIPQNLQAENTPQNLNEESDENMNPMVKMILIGYMSKLIKLAEQNADPQLGADFVVEKIPDEIIGLMELDNWFELLSEAVPKTAPHKDWLTKARDLALAELNSEESDPTGAAG